MIELTTAAGFAQGLAADVVEGIAQREAVAAFVAAGTCLEGQGVQSGDILCVAFRRTPERGDICLCRLDGPGRSYPVFKMYLHRELSGVHAVETSYIDSGRNRRFYTGKVYGTVFAQVRDGATLWEKPILDRPPKAPPVIAPGRCTSIGAERRGA